MRNITPVIPTRAVPVYTYAHMKQLVGLIALAVVGCGGGNAEAILDGFYQVGDFHEVQAADGIDKLLRGKRGHG